MKAGSTSSGKCTTQCVALPRHRQCSCACVRGSMCRQVCRKEWAERARRQDAGFDVDEAARQMDAECLERAKAAYDAVKGRRVGTQESSPSNEAVLAKMFRALQPKGAGKGELINRPCVWTITSNLPPCVSSCVFCRPWKRKGKWKGERRQQRQEDMGR